MRILPEGNGLMATILHLRLIAGADGPEYEFGWKARGKRETETVRERLVVAGGEGRWESGRRVWRIAANGDTALILALCFSNFWELRDLLSDQPGLLMEAT